MIRLARPTTLVVAAVLSFLSLRTATAQSTAFGDTLFTFNAGLLTETPDRTLNGIVFAEGHFWVTGFNLPVVDHRLYKIDASGTEVVSSTSLGEGYHAYADLAYDGEFLWAADRDRLAQIDPADGLPTGVEIPVDFGVYLVRGVAYDPATDHFWVIPQRNGQLQVVHEIDRDGNVLNTYPNLDTDNTVALTWDTWSPGGPFLWTFSREEIGLDSRFVFRQFSPAIGAFTGVEFEIVNRSQFAQDTPLGAALTADLDAERVTMVALQGGSLDPTDGLDWVVVYDADLQNTPPPSPQVSVNPAAIDVEVEEGETIEVPVSIGNNGDLDLTWEAYAESNTPPDPGAGEVGDVLTSVDLTGIIDSTGFIPRSITYARDHLWLTGRISGGINRLYKVTPDGNVVETYPYGTSSGIGWRAIVNDGDFIYGIDQYAIAVWSLDQNAIADYIFTGDIGASGMAYDSNNEHFYLGAWNGAIEVIDREGEEVRLIVTPYTIEGLAWDDFSPGGPFLWAWTEPSDSTGACCEAVQLDPVTGLPTGVSFAGENQGDLANEPDAAVITRDLVPGRLTLIGLQEAEGYTPDEAYAVGYDLGVKPPPAWLDLEGATRGTVEPGGADTLTVAFHGVMSDTTMSATLRFATNDLTQPVVEVPINISMVQAQPVSTEDPGAATGQFTLEQNYPNPFGPRTRIGFELPETAEVELEIFDIRGRRVATLSESFSAGRHEFEWDGTSDGGRRVASGVYIYTLKAGDATATRRMLLMR